MNLKPQDIVILLKLVTIGDRLWSYSSLANELAIRPSEVHSGIGRVTAASLFDPQRKVPLLKFLLEFLVHGVKYSFPTERGSLTRGMPTSYAGPPLNSNLIQADEPPPVWPDPKGCARGYEFSPLNRSVPKAAKRDNELYELLTLVDAIRDERVRERELAEKELTIRLQKQPNDRN